MSEKLRAGQGVDTDPQWRVDGALSDDDQLGDTVVRIPPIRPDDPAPAPVKRPSAPSHSAPTGFEPTSPLEFPANGFSASAPDAWTVAAPEAAIAAVPVEAPPTAVRPSAVKQKVRRTRKARLRLSRLDPWSVMKTVFLFSIAFGIMTWVATYITWSVVEASGLFEALNQTITTIVSNSNDANPFKIEDYLSTNKVLGVTALLAVINVVLLTAIGTLFAFLYNLSANILGGLELTLAED